MYDSASKLRPFYNTCAAYLPELGDRFVIIGGALVLRGFELAYEAPFVNECLHHLRSSVRPDHLHPLETVKIAVELSNVEALAAVVSYAAFKNATAVHPSIWIAVLSG